MRILANFASFLSKPQIPSEPENLKETIGAHVRPLTQLQPDKRLKAVVECIILGILGSETPVITEIAQSNSKAEGETWPIAKRIYRFLSNLRVKTENLYEGMYQIGQGLVEQENQTIWWLRLTQSTLRNPMPKQ